MIPGVEIRHLGPPQCADHRGTLLEVIDTQDPFWSEPIVYAYRFTVRPGRIKGWGMHELQTDRYLITQGRVRVVLCREFQWVGAYMDKPRAPEFDEFFFTDETPGLLMIPPGVWHADQNVGDTDVVIVNFPTVPFNHEHPDKQRRDLSEIPFDWTLRDY